MMISEYDLNKTFQVIRMQLNDSDTGDREIPKNYKNIRGRLSSFSGNRQLLYDRETYSNSCRFYCLYDSDIAQTDYIRDVAESKTYKIISIANPGGENELLQIDLTINDNRTDLIPNGDWIEIPKDIVIDGGEVKVKEE